jgi:hypothetical protein
MPDNKQNAKGFQARLNEAPKQAEAKRKAGGGPRYDMSTAKCLGIITGFDDIVRKTRPVK